MMNIDRILAWKRRKVNRFVLILSEKYTRPSLADDDKAFAERYKKRFKLTLWVFSLSLLVAVSRSLVELFVSSTACFINLRFLDIISFSIAK